MPETAALTIKAKSLSLVVLWPVLRTASSFILMALSAMPRRVRMSSQSTTPIVNMMPKLR